MAAASNPLSVPPCSNLLLEMTCSCLVSLLSLYLQCISCCFAFQLHLPSTAAIIVRYSHQSASSRPVKEWARPLGRNWIIKHTVQTQRIVFVHRSTEGLEQHQSANRPIYSVSDYLPLAHLDLHVPLQHLTLVANAYA